MLALGEVASADHSHPFAMCSSRMLPHDGKRPRPAWRTRGPRVSFLAMAIVAAFPQISLSVPQCQELANIFAFPS